MTIDTPLHHYQVVPPWDRDTSLRTSEWNIPGGEWDMGDNLDDYECMQMDAWNGSVDLEELRIYDNSEERLTVGDSLTVLMQNLYRMRRVSHEWNPRTQAYDVWIYTEEAHEEFLNYFHSRVAEQCDCELVKAKIR